MSQPLSTTLTGVAGEYLVAGELSRRGWIASITLRNTKGVDILVTSEDDLSRSVGIQVKTNRSSKPQWLLNKKAEEVSNPAVFYALVRLMDGGVPQYHIVPSTVMAKYISQGHREWLVTPGRGGRPHKDTPMRQFKDPADEFLNRWDLLGLDG